MPAETVPSPKDRLVTAIAERFPGYQYQDIEAIITNERPVAASVWLPFAITPVGHDPWDTDRGQHKPAGILQAQADTTNKQLDLMIWGMLEDIADKDFAECYGEES